MFGGMSHGSAPPAPTRPAHDGAGPGPDLGFRRADLRSSVRTAVAASNGPSWGAGGEGHRPADPGGDRHRPPGDHLRPERGGAGGERLSPERGPLPPGPPGSGAPGGGDHPPGPAGGPPTKAGGNLGPPGPRPGGPAGYRRGVHPAAPGKNKLRLGGPGPEGGGGHRRRGPDLRGGKRPVGVPHPHRRHQAVLPPGLPGLPRHRLCQRGGPGGLRPGGRLRRGPGGGERQGPHRQKRRRHGDAPALHRLRRRPGRLRPPPDPGRGDPAVRGKGPGGGGAEVRRAPRRLLHRHRAQDRGPPGPGQLSRLRPEPSPGHRGPGNGGPAGPPGPGPLGG